MSKSKGSRSERELFHMFWGKNWATVRSAGSGSTTKPAPDLLASNGTRTFAIECNAIKGNRKYFDQEEIDQLVEFSESFGAEPWIGVRFDKRGWFFIEVSKLTKSNGNSLCVTYDLVQEKGLIFEQLIGAKVR